LFLISRLPITNELIDTNLLYERLENMAMQARGIRYNFTDTFLNHEVISFDLHLRFVFKFLISSRLKTKKFVFRELEEKNRQYLADKEDLVKKYIEANAKIESLEKLVI
jgi:hypothetical protein